MLELGLALGSYRVYHTAGRMLILRRYRTPVAVCQSAYRAHHSTETAILKVTSDILSALDSGDLALLTLLDLSAAFDTVDHVILLQRLKTSYGISGPVLGWLTCYLSNRTQFVQRGSSQSKPSAVICGVPRGSVLRPILFLLYTIDLARLAATHGLHVHLYADDTQVYGSCHTDGVAPLQDVVSTCVGDMSTWMRSNRLQLNTKKTEVLWCTSSRRQDQIPAIPLHIGTDNVMPISSVPDLGVYLNADLMSMATHISRMVVSCFGILRQIRSVQRSLPRHAVTSLVTSLVLTRLDYCNSVRAGLPANLLNRLQTVINPAARLICSARKSEHITPNTDGPPLAAYPRENPVQTLCPGV